MKLTDTQKKVAMVAAGAIVLYLVYRWYSNQQSSTASTGVQAPSGTTASDYAALAGQEQADVAGLQGQLSSMGAQETSDISALTGQQTTATGQEASDISGLTAAMNTLTGTVGDVTTGLGTLTTSESGLQTEITALAAGQQQLNRQQATQTIQTHKGGPFYNYYVRLTGHAPPATVQTTNAIYQLWKAGVNQAKLTPHPSAPKNNQIAHPNGNHAQQKPVKPAPPKPPPKPPPPPAKPKPAPPKPTAKTKPKPSGVRR